VCWSAQGRGHPCIVFWTRRDCMQACLIMNRSARGWNWKSARRLQQVGAFL
jgi:hypothetical protein